MDFGLVLMVGHNFQDLHDLSKSIENTRLIHEDFCIGRMDAIVQGEEMPRF